MKEFIQNNFDRIISFFLGGGITLTVIKIKKIINKTTNSQKIKGDNNNQTINSNDKR